MVTQPIIPVGWHRINIGKVKKHQKYRYPHFTSDASRIDNWRPFGYSCGVSISELPDTIIIIEPDES